MGKTMPYVEKASAISERDDEEGSCVVRENPHGLRNCGARRVCMPSDSETVIVLY